MKTETRKVPNGNRAVTRRVIELAGNMEYSPAEALRAARINRSRAQYMTGRTVAGLPLGEAMVAFYDGLMAGLKDVNLQKQREQLLINAASRDPQVAAVARKTLASLRVEVFSNYLYAPALWMNQYAEVINLKDDERPIAQRNTKQEVGITGVGGDGSPHMVKISLDPDETLIPLGYLTTDIVRYRKVDIYRGRVVDPALATINLSYDFGQKLDGQVQNLLIGNASTFFGPFTFTGKRANWSYVAHSRIITANLPPSNDVICLQQDNATPVNGFGFQVLAWIVDYSARWDGAFQDGVNLKPTGRILLPPGHIKNIAQGIFPSGAMRNKIADELMEQGWFGVHYLGVDWLFVPDNTLDPTVMACYPEFNKKPVQVFFKPGLDEEKSSANDYQIESKNEEERYMRRVFGAYYDSSRRAYAARFNYNGTNTPA
ncbi:MAG: hypothetical protein WCG85_13370 [Polyangia bacterium]